MKEPAGQQEETWDVVLRPQAKWFSFEPQQIWKYRDLLVLFVRRDLITYYKQTILGPAWVVLQPILTAIVLSFVFNRVARLPTGHVPPFLFYLGGLVPWMYFADCLTKTSNTFVSNTAVFGKVYFPRMITPLSVVVSSFVKFFIQLVVFSLIYLFFVFVWGKDVQPNAHLAFLPLLVLLLAGTGLGMGMFVSSLTTKYRDLVFLIGFGTQLLMYASSVIFPYAQAGAMQAYLKWNPILWIVEAFRYAMYSGGVWSWTGLAYSACFMIVLLAGAIGIFHRVEKNFMDTV